MTRRARILLATESLRPTSSGIGRVARLMAAVLAERARTQVLDVSALALNDPEPAADTGLVTRTAGGSRARYVAGVQLAALRSTHAIYDFAGMGRAHPPGWLGRHLPYLVWIHGIEVWEQGRDDHVRVAREARVLVTNTEYTRARASRLHPELSSARVCWLGTETDADPPDAPAREHPPTVLILSRIDAGGGYKGHRELIDAWPSVVAAVPGARLLIAGGGGGAREIEAYAERSNARASIELRGFVPQSDIDAVWQETSIFAMPSRGEGFGLAYVEAMRHKIPVVGSIHDAAGEVNVDAQTGYNVDLDRPEQLVDRLVRLLRDRDHAAQLGRAGYERWRTHFTYSAFRARFTPILDDLLELHA